MGKDLILIFTTWKTPQVATNLNLRAIYAARCVETFDISWNCIIWKIYPPLLRHLKDLGVMFEYHLYVRCSQ